MNNEAPGLVRSGISPGIRPLFHSRREIALIKDKSAAAGYGVLKQGYVLGVTTDDSRVVPIPVDDGSVDAVDIARSRLVVNATDSGTTVTVSEADGAKFRVGDNVALSNLTPAYDDLGAITAIAAAVNGQVVITVDGSVTGAVFTTANRAALYQVTDASTPFYKAACILDKDIDTGSGGIDDAAVPTSVVFGNCMLYTVYLTGMSAESIADLGAIQDGVHTIIK